MAAVSQPASMILSQKRPNLVCTRDNLSLRRPRPDVNVRAERTKPYGLRPSPEGALPFQHGSSAPCHTWPYLPLKEIMAPMVLARMSRSR